MDELHDRTTYVRTGEDLAWFLGRMTDDLVERQRRASSVV